MVSKELRQLVVEMLELASPAGPATVSEEDIKRLAALHADYLHATRPAVVLALLDFVDADERYRSAAARFAQTDMEHAREDQEAARSRLAALWATGRATTKSRGMGGDGLDG